MTVAHPNWGHMGLGHVHDSSEALAKYIHAAVLVGGVQSSTYVDYMSLFSNIRNQGATGTCVGQTCAEVDTGQARIRGITIDDAAAIPFYVGALGNKEPMQDLGCDPSSALAWWYDHGAVSDKRYPFDPALVTKELPFDVLVAGYQSRAQAAYRIPTGDLGLIRQAVSAGFLPMCSFEVDKGFDAYSSGVLGGTYDPTTTRGKHYMPCIGFKYDTDNWFRLLNHWGKGFGESGTIRMSEDRMAEATNIIVVTTIPTVLR